MLKWIIFALLVTHWTQEEDADDTWYGLRLFSVDGTQFRAPDTPALAE
ncbi:IS4 family transposase, partial [Pseudoalteromonas sp. SWN29]|nr:IS4 family transposase [Pseudoalteromonas sp. SWN29]